MIRIMRKLITAAVLLALVFAAPGCGAKSDLWDMPNVFSGADAGADAGTDADVDTEGDMDVHEPEPELPPDVSTWIVRMGGDEADLAMSAASAAGGLFVAGQTRSFVRNPGPTLFDIDVWVIGLDLDGRVLVQESMGTTANDEAHAVIAGRNGNIIVAGSTESYGAGYTDMWVLEFDSGGRIQEQETVGTNDWDHAYALTETSDGGLALAGTFMGGEGVVKLDADGRVAWYAAMHFLDIYAVAETTGGGLAVTGNWAGQDIWIGMLDTAGNLLWQKQIGSVRYDSAWGIMEAGDGNIVVCGNTEPFTTISETWPLEMWVGKLARDGTLLWQRTVGGEGGESGNDVVEDADGNLIVAGTASAMDDENYDMAVLKLDAGGAIVWQKLLGGSGYEEARSVTVTHDGGIVAVGSVSDDEASSPDVLIAKMGPGGEMQSPCRLVRDSAFTSEESRLPVSDGTMEPRIEGEIFLQPSADSARPSDAIPGRLCPEL
jgi:predicted small lipoprotein YifL